MAELSPVLLFKEKYLATGLKVSIKRENPPPPFLKGQENKNEITLFVCFEISN
jgi:hypothetical protein